MNTWNIAKLYVHMHSTLIHRCVEFEVSITDILGADINVAENKYGY